MTSIDFVSFDNIYLFLCYSVAPIENVELWDTSVLLGQLELEQMTTMIQISRVFISDDFACTDATYCIIFVIVYLGKPILPPIFLHILWYRHMEQTTLKRRHSAWSLLPRTVLAQSFPYPGHTLKWWELVVYGRLQKLQYSTLIIWVDV